MVQITTERINYSLVAKIAEARKNYFAYGTVITSVLLVNHGARGNLLQYHDHGIRCIERVLSTLTAYPRQDLHMFTTHLQIYRCKTMAACLLRSLVAMVAHVFKQWCHLVSMNFI